MSAIRGDAGFPQSGVPSYLSRLTQAPLLSQIEEQELTRAAREGCASSRQKLIESNMRLVINIARGYHCRQIPLEDLIQEGAIGLIYAVERFDPDRGFRFSTYATHWIRQSVGRAIDNKAKAIRLPAHVSQSLRRIEKARAEYIQTHGSEPSVEDLAELSEICPVKLQKLLEIGQDILSLDMKVGGSDGITLGALVKDDETSSPETQAISNEMSKELNLVLGKLNESERQVMLRKFKMEAGETVENGEAESQTSKSRAKQLEAQAVRKLRQLAHLRRLKEHLGS